MFFWQAGFFILFLETLLTFAIMAETGFLTVFLLCILSGMAGVFLIRAQGFAILVRAKSSFDRGLLPVDEIFQGLCLLAAGALLILPGFLSDAIALCLLIPFIRSFVRYKGAGLFNLREPLREGDIIEGEYVRVQEKTEQIVDKSARRDRR